MKTLYYRIFQNIMRLSSYVLPWRQPERLEGENAVSLIPEILKGESIKKVLIVSDKMINELGLMKTMLETFDKHDIQYEIYDKTVPNPTIDNIEEALSVYHSTKCEGLIAFGGGSPMDCAKGVGARIARPKKSIPQMKGILKVRKKLPLFIAIPTTAGTGSETTLAAVITNSETHEKYSLSDLPLIPNYAVLDPQLTKDLPQHITSTTGIDALTHAVEAYIGKSNTAATKEASRQAIQLVFVNLEEAYNNGHNMQARKKMQEAAYLAGVAFTRAYIGYVHAIAHTLGGFYSVPHGLANAVILPYVLDYYGRSVEKPLAELADLLDLGNKDDSRETKAKAFILAVRDLNKKLNIPTKIQGIKTEDIPLMIKRASAEAHPLYPVPQFMSAKDMENIYHAIMEAK